MAEVLLYGPIFSQSAIDYINAINAIDDNELITRLNTGGGDVMYGWGIVAKFNEFAGTKKVKVDGMAYSMGAVKLLFADNVEVLDVSKIMFHRAAYSPWFEEGMSDAIRGELMEVNADIEKAFRAKIDVPKFEKMKGIKVKDLFSMDGRIDVFLNAKEAKEIGLVDKIVKLTPVKRAELQSEFDRMAANHPGMEIPKLPEITSEVTEDAPIKTKNMNIEELKAKHPELYAQIVALGSSEGVAQERDRVGAWAAWTVADPEAVKAGIASDKNISQTEMSEFAVKLASKGKLAEIEEEGNTVEGKNAVVEAPVVVEAPTAAANFEKEIMSHLNIEKKS